jgi:hypothetical protein
VLLRVQSNGLGFNGCSAEVVASAILDGAPSSSEKGELGAIMVGCDEAAHCGELLLLESLVARNTGEGVSIWGTGTTEIRETVLRDQVSGVTGTNGNGLAALCDVNGAGCGLVRTIASVIRGNQISGVSLDGASLELERSIVRDTEVQASSGNGGTGVAAGCDSDTAACGTLQITDSLLLGNHGAGLFLAGVQSTLRGAHVRGTLPMAIGGGMGVMAMCDPDLDVCGSLDLGDSTIRESWTAGVYVAGGAASLTGIEVLGVSPLDTGLATGLFGHGVVCACIASNQSGTVMCSTCALDNLRVEDAYVAGVQLDGASGTARRIVVRDVGPQVRDAVYGYGIQVDALAEGAPVVFHVLGSLIANADLAGVLYSHATGTLSQTTVQGADFSVVWTEPDHAPEILESNDLTGVMQDEPSLQTALTPAPAPPPLAPSAI